MSIYSHELLLHYLLIVVHFHSEIPTQPPSDPILNSFYSPPNQMTLPVSLFLLTTQPREELLKEMELFVNYTKIEGGIWNQSCRDQSSESYSRSKTDAEFGLDLGEAYK